MARRYDEPANQGQAQHIGYQADPSQQQQDRYRAYAQGDDYAADYYNQGNAASSSSSSSQRPSNQLGRQNSPAFYAQSHQTPHSDGYPRPPQLRQPQARYEAPFAAGPSQWQEEEQYAGFSRPGQNPTDSSVYGIALDAPILPPQNSVWHQQVDAGYASQARRPIGRASPPPPPQEPSIAAVLTPQQPARDRPVSSATGIISLYGDLSRRDSFSSDTSSEEEYKRAQRRSARPLPTVPGGPQRSPLPTPPPTSNAQRDTLRAGQSADALRSPATSNPLTPPSDSSSGETASQSAQKISQFPSRPSHSSSYWVSDNGPMWSPTLNAGGISDSSADSSYISQSSSSSGRHRQQQSSLGAASTFMSGSSPGYADSSASESGAWPQARSRTVSQPGRRAPLPSVPSSLPQAGHGLGAGLGPSNGRAARYDAPKDQQDSLSQTGIRPQLANMQMSSSSTVSSVTPRERRTDSWDSSMTRSNTQRSDKLMDAFQPQTVKGKAILPNQRGNDSRLSRIAFVNFALLSHLAMLVREAVPRGSHVKGSISYPSSFTGKDIVTALQSVIPKALAQAGAGVDSATWEDTDQQAKLRRLSLYAARALHRQLFFNEVDLDGVSELQDGVEQVYMFLSDTIRQDEEKRRPTPSPFEQQLDSIAEVGLDLSLAYEAPTLRQRERPIASNDLEDLPTGIFVPLTNCYSPLCGRSDDVGSSGACYSPSCPRAKKTTLRRGLTLTGEIAEQDAAANAKLAGAAGGVAHKAWAELVSKEVLDSIPKREVTRQNAILEHIQKEEDFLADLQLLESLFIKGLERPSATGDPSPIPIGPERDDFIREVFSNYRELIMHVSAFVERLHVRQREESPIIQSIGDIFLDAALEWQGAFVTYVANYPIAKSRIVREQTINPRFAAFVEACRREPACRRLGLDNFIHRALPHLQRHPLLLQTIIDKTDESNPDRESCVSAKEVIVEQCKIADTDIQAAQIKAKIRGFAYNLQAKRNKALVDMDLLNPERQLIHEGRVYRKPDFTELDWTEMQSILFDNYLVVTKLKGKQEEGDLSSNAVFVLAKRPVPVDMLEISGLNEPSTSYSIGLNALHFRGDRESRDLWPFTVHHIGNKMEPLTLYTTSKQARNLWRAKIEEAKGLRRAVVEANKAFETTDLCNSIFALPTMTGLDLEKPPPGADSTIFHGQITCAVPFRMVDGRRLVALGCADGVWIGLRSDPSSFRKVLHLKMVTQCAVLEDFGIFVVLADKALISYSLEALVPSSTNGAVQPRPPQKLSGNKGVLFFGVGVLKDRTLLIYMKKKANESVFKALEPVINQPGSSNGKTTGLFTKIKNDMGKNAEWFRMYKVFFIPSEAYSMQFLRSKLAVVCSRGFEIMNLDTLLPGTIPDFTRSARDDPRILNLARRVETSKALGMYKLDDGDFLLCYDAFACYVDRGGEPIRLDSIVEWEGSPQSVAFSSPYILAFDTRFVEIREASTGRLVQIVRGHDIRYISASTVVEGSSAEHSIFCVQRKRVNAGRGYEQQATFELIQTAPPRLGPADLSRTDTSATTSSLGIGSAYSQGTGASTAYGGVGAQSIGLPPNMTSGGTIRRPSNPSGPPSTNLGAGPGAGQSRSMAMAMDRSFSGLAQHAAVAANGPVVQSPGYAGYTNGGGYAARPGMGPVQVQGQGHTRNAPSQMTFYDSTAYNSGLSTGPGTPSGATGPTTTTPAGWI